MSLVKYRQKRDFKKTSEPKAQRASGSRHRYVIQKHDASRLHYDFRLELGGTLKSWAVPKGVPFEHGERKLAVQVEDHPVSYRTFEGTIPKGEYGGGTVMVWDYGTYKPLSSSPARDLEKGKLHFELRGKKLRGEWYLVRLRDESQWLLIRGGDNFKPVSKKQDDTSALSGRSMNQISRNGTEKPKEPRAKRRPGKIIPVPKFVEPMKARLVETPPTGAWIYEIKFDGWRALALKGSREVRLMSRNKKEFNDKFPDVAAAAQEIPADDAIIDGEIVALNSKGVSSFQLLQSYDLNETSPPLFYYAFDLLRLSGKDLRDRPLEERKSLLEDLLIGLPDGIRYSATLGTDAATLLTQARALGLEGLIGKKSGSRYEAGKRSGTWVKLKLHAEQEFVIGGYTEPEGARHHFGALLVGYHQNGKLMFAGKVGTGFNEAMLRSLFHSFRKIARKTCPFANLPESHLGKWKQGITPAVFKHCHWVKPELVCQIKFGEWTQEGKLRQPVFLGLRKDKDAREVVREKTA